MVQLVNASNRQLMSDLVRQMHADRKRIFVDWLDWDVPHDGILEQDQFDTPDAEYLILADSDGCHLGSVRLLRTDEPHLLSEIFPGLCEGPIPSGPHLREITRLCVSPSCPSDQRGQVMCAIVTALTEYALLQDLAGYTLVSDVDFLQRIISTGWRCEMLGMPERCGADMVAALRVHIDAATIPELRKRGIYTSPRLVLTQELEAA
jgi:N-acyl-L-homoserine lactone synthetase